MEYRRAWVRSLWATLLFSDLCSSAIAQVGTVPANQVQAGPTSGSPGLPSYRLLVAADIPGGLPITSAGIDVICNTNGGFLERITGTWSCASIGANTVLGSVAGGAPAALTQAQLTAMLNLATASLQGALPAWPNNTTTFFRGDGTYVTLNCAAIGNAGTVCTANTGTSGHTIPFLDGNLIFSGTIAASGLGTGTPSQALCLDGSNNVIKENSANCFGNTGAARGDLNGSNWSFTTPTANAYVLVPLSHVAYNDGSVYTVYPGSYSTATPPTNTYFKPPAGTTLVCFGAELFVQSGASLGSSHNAIIKIIKDFVVNSSGVEQSGIDVGEGQLPSYYGNTTSVAGVLSVCDKPANNNEYYGLFIYIDGASGSTGGDAIVVSGNIAHTAFSMSVIR